MRHIKMLGLAAITALAAMAFVGASSASATGSTGLCPIDEAPCTSGLITHVHETATGVKLKTSLLTVTCGTALFLGDVLSPFLGNPLHIIGVGPSPPTNNESFIYSSCTSSLGGGSCDVLELNGPALVTILRTGVERSEVTGKAEFLAKCGVSLHCVYNWTNLKGEGLGALLASPNGEWKVENFVLNKVGGTLCPATSELSALYKPLIATYIST